MLDARIQQQFFDAADWLNQAAEALGRPLAAAAQALLGSITAGAKVLVLGQPDTAPLAEHFAACLMRGLERERPPLAAWVLSAQLSAEETPRLALAEAQIRAQAQPGDVLVVVVNEAATPPLLEAVRLAQSCEVTVVVLAARAQAALAQSLRESDVMVSIPAPRAARSHELILTSMHCLIDAIETQLLGEQDSP